MRARPLLLRYLSTKVVVLLMMLGVADIVAQDQFTVVGFEGYPLAYVTATTGQQVLSGDIDGRIVIPAELQYEDSLTIDYVGYISLKTTVTAVLRDNIIQLVPNTSATVTIVGRTNRPADRIIGEVDIIRKEQIQLSQAQTTADALEANANVYVQRSQMGGGSPVLRGFEANRVLLVNDGVRMNNAIYRSGHLQNAITIDPHLLDQVEVIYGPGALLYGSDALGGVVHFRTVDPKLRLQKNVPAIKGDVYMRHASVNDEITVHGHLDYGTKKWAGITSISFSDFGDLWSGKYHRYNEDDDPDYGLRREFQTYYINRFRRLTISTNPTPRLQVNTGYWQINFAQKVKRQLTRRHYLLLDIQINRNSTIPRYDQLLETNTWLKWHYADQERYMYSLKSVWSRRTRFFDQVTTQLSKQEILESRVTQRTSSAFTNGNSEAVDVWNLTIDAQKQIRESVSLKYGVQASNNIVNSSAGSSDRDRNQRPILTRYADDLANMRSVGSYAIAEYDRGQHNIQAGVRYSQQQVDLRYADSIIVWPSNYYQGVTNMTSALTGSIAHRYKHEQWSIGTSVGTAFRAPNVDDQAKIRVKGDEVTIPNLDLEPERSLTTEVNIGYQAGDGLQATITTFYTRLTNAIVQAPASLPDGSSTVEQDGSILTTITNVNAAAADIAGISLSSRYNFSPALRLDASISYTRGWQYLEGETSPLSHIPPLYGRLAITYEKDQWTGSAQLRFNGAKPLDQYGGSPDNIELATPIGTPAWYVIDLSAQRRLGDCWQVEFGIDNLLNRFYRPFASGVNGPGFGVIVGLRFSF